MDCAERSTAFPFLPAAELRSVQSIEKDIALGLTLSTAKRGLCGWLVGHAEMGCFEALVVLDFRRQAAFQDAADQESTFDRVRRHVSLKHLFDSMHQAR